MKVYATNVPKSAHSKKDGNAGNIIKNHKYKFYSIRALLSNKVKQPRKQRENQATYPVSCIHSVYGSSNDHGDVIRTRNIHEEKKTNEMSVIIVTYTVIDPGAVVIHTKDASNSE